jgi:hypothetical protein
MNIKWKDPEAAESHPEQIILRSTVVILAFSCPACVGGNFTPPLDALNTIDQKVQARASMVVEMGRNIAQTLPKDGRRGEWSRNAGAGHAVLPSRSSPSNLSQRPCERGAISSNSSAYFVSLH